MIEYPCQSCSSYSHTTSNCPYRRRKGLRTAALGLCAAILAGCGAPSTAPGPIPPRDGTYAVGTQVAYGAYRSTQATCRWTVDRGADGGKHSGRGAVTIRLRDHDLTVTVRGCGRWTTVRG